MTNPSSEKNVRICFEKKKLFYVYMAYPQLFVSA